MKLTPAMLIARKVAGYRPPVEDEVCCKHCGAKRTTREYFAPYYCLRHMFYVHSHGWCPAFDTRPYTPPAPKKPPFVQTEMSFQPVRGETSPCPTPTKETT